jgi:HlyD family secretion protein
MKRSTWAVVAGGAVVAAGLLAWAFAPRPVMVEVAYATPTTFETAVEEEGRTRVRERHAVVAPLAGRLRRIALQEGDTVAVGAVVAVIEPQLAPLLDERALREQRARVAAAGVAVERAATGIEAARVAVQRADNEARRSAQLVDQGFVAPLKAEADRLALQAAQRELQAARESERIARHELEQARAALGLAAGGARAGAAAAVFELRSPVAGRVLKLAQPSETVVQVGTPLLELADLSRLEVVAELLTSDAAALRPGGEVRVERWGGPGALAGRVRMVEPAAYTKVSALGVEEQRVEVVVDVTADPARPAALPAALGDGWRVLARFVTRREPDVLTVPVSAVFPWPQDAPAWALAAGEGPGADDAEGLRMGVFVAESGRARLRPVLVGARNGALAWVRQGLAEGTAVIVYPPAAVADGVRVKERRGD